MWIQISSGRGPDECELAVSHLVKTLLIENEKIKVVDMVPGNITGNFKSVLLSIAEEEKSKVENINGSVLWICKSPYRPFHKRKNWFIDVESFDEGKRFAFSEHDIKFEAMRSSGPGGQNVNKVETAIRATYLPLNIAVVAREERSQYRNKKLAIARLSKIIDQRNQDGSLDQRKNLWVQHNELERGNPIRVYSGESFSRKK